MAKGGQRSIRHVPSSIRRSAWSGQRRRCRFDRGGIDRLGCMDSFERQAQRSSSSYFGNKVGLDLTRSRAFSNSASNRSDACGLRAWYHADVSMYSARASGWNVTSTTYPLPALSFYFGPRDRSNLAGPQFSRSPSHDLRRNRRRRLIVRLQGDDQCFRELKAVDFRKGHAALKSCSAVVLMKSPPRSSQAQFYPTSRFIAIEPRSRVEPPVEFHPAIEHPGGRFLVSIPWDQECTALGVSWKEGGE